MNTVSACGVTLTQPAAKLSRLSIDTSPAELLTRKTCQLSALLENIGGEGLPRFHAQHADQRDALLWLAADLALEARLLAELVAQSTLRTEGRA